MLNCELRPGTQHCQKGTPEYTVYTTAWGETRKSWRHITSTPQ